MNKIMSLRKKELLESGLLGVVWIIVGLLQLFELNKSIKIIVAIFILAASIAIFIPYFVKTDKEDEMADFNMKKAKSSVYHLLYLGIIACTIISVFKEGFVIDLKLIMPFLAGGVNLLKFIFFIVYEKVGN